MLHARLSSLVGLIVTLLGLSALPAHAVLPDEIQVYTGDINAPGEFGLELHLNTTPSGISEPSYPREVTTPHGWRATAEFSYGLTSSVELGLYVPTALTRENTYYVMLCLAGGPGCLPMGCPRPACRGGSLTHGVTRCGAWVSRSVFRCRRLPMVTGGSSIEWCSCPGTSCQTAFGMTLFAVLT
jgi:hypothetical protein